jgi:hypothetical protein
MMTLASPISLELHLLMMLESYLLMFIVQVTGLMFGEKARDYQAVTLKFLALLTNIGLGCEKLPQTNNHAICPGHERAKRAP